MLRIEENKKVIPLFEIFSTLRRPRPWCQKCLKWIVVHSAVQRHLKWRSEAIKTTNQQPTPSMRTSCFQSIPFRSLLLSLFLIYHNLHLLFCLSQFISFSHDSIFLIYAIWPPHFFSLGFVCLFVCFRFNFFNFCFFSQGVFLWRL